MLYKIYKYLKKKIDKKFIININKHKDYKNYLSHQKKKTTDPIRINKWLNKEWEIKYLGFKDIFDRNILYVKDKENAICLGARTGQEVKALQDLNINAIGIDLVPFSPYTIKGDIHNLQFKDMQFDLVFTNIIDHSLYPEKFVKEMQRVCTNNGIIIVHLQLGDNIDIYTENIIFDPKVIISLFSESKLLQSKKINNLHDSMHWELIFAKASELQ